ncbi:MAG TPA: hypothetical protein VID68_13780 [Solirubrobacteraceae bacterium]
MSLSAVALGPHIPVWPGGGVIGARHPSGFAAWVGVTDPILRVGFAAFTARLRDAVEIDAIRGDLLDAVNRAVEPAHVSVWIKP